MFEPANGYRPIRTASEKLTHFQEKLMPPVDSTVFFHLKRNILQHQVGLFSLDQVSEHAEAKQSKSTIGEWRTTWWISVCIWIHLLCQI